MRLAQSISLWRLAASAALAAGGFRAVAAAEATTRPARTEAEADLDAVDSDSVVEEVFACDFSKKWDRNYDGKPDYWTRTTDFPRYVDYALYADPAGEVAGAVEVRLNGGGIVLVGPPFPVQNDDEFQLTLKMQTAGLSRHAAWGEIAFFAEEADDPEGVVDAAAALASSGVDRLSGDQGWVLRRSPRVAAPEGARSGRVILRLEPQIPPGDVYGLARFADLQVTRRSRAALQLPEGRFRQPTEVVRATLELARTIAESGLRWTLTDQYGRPAASGVALATDAAQAAPGRYAWRSEFQFGPLEPGYYRLEVWEDDDFQVAATSLAVSAEQFARQGMEFGWGTPGLHGSIRESVLRETLAASGVAWVKSPMWPETERLGEIERLVEFIEWLSQRGIELIGVLGTPPDDVRARMPNPERPTAAEVFSTNPDLWQSRLEVLLTHIALRVRRWQLGDDGDVSFSGHRNVEQVVASAGEVLSRFGRKAELAIGWSWLAPVPNLKTEAWSFLNFAATPNLTADEIQGLLEKNDGGSGGWWSPVQPLPKGKYADSTRILDLVLRMAAAQRSGASMIYVPRPYDPRSGLVGADGRPTELFVPWRIAVSVLAGAVYGGDIHLDGLENQLFVRDGQGILLVWGDSPRELRLDLGTHVQAFDLWGRRIDTRIEQDSSAVIAYEGRALYVLGVNPQLAAWQRRLKLESPHIPIIPSVSHDNALIIENPFAVGVAGVVQIEAPLGWLIEPRRVPFQLAPGEQSRTPLRIRLGADAELGAHPLPMRVQLHATSSQEFTVQREVILGDGSLRFDVATRRGPGGVLEVEQLLSNDGEESVSFDFQLYAPRRRQISYGVRSLGRGVDRHVFRLDDADQLAGRELWIRGVEIRGDRVINHRVRVAP